MSDTTTYTIWKKCDNCATLNEQAKNRCHECGLMLLN